MLCQIAATHKLVVHPADDDGRSAQHLLSPLTDLETEAGVDVSMSILVRTM